MGDVKQARLLAERAGRLATDEATRYLSRAILALTDTSLVMQDNEDGEEEDETSAPETTTKRRRRTRK